MSSNKDFYRETVFLPKTDFPMRAGLPKKEPEILGQWKNLDLYKTLRERSKDREKWILHWGPPYANGQAHIGHALTKTLKDVVNRSWQMMGYNAPMVPGWDCHGLPIEWKIEEQYRARGEDKDDADIIDFREECRQFAQKWVGVQTADFERLGVLADFENPYLTMSHGAESAIVKEIHKFALNGGLYRGAKPVMWSVVEKTALAEAEIEYKEHKSVTVWVRFPVIKTPLALLEGTDIVIWTTTPWTLPSNRAVAYGNNVEYGVYEFDGQKIAVATSLAEEVKTQAKIEDWTLIGTFTGADAAGTICAHPLRGQGYDFDAPMLSGDFVTDDAGTGFVHIAPGHGEDDFYLGIANNVEVTDNVADDGIYRDHVPLFAGLAVYDQKGALGDGNWAVLKALNEAGKLLAKGSLKHEYPHSWRSKAPIIFRTTPQWFIAMDKNDLRENALSAIKKTKWVPAKGETRITAMIENRPDWCISRQRTWGVPIALFVHKDTKEILTDELVLNRIAETFEAEGADAWWTHDAQGFLGESYDVDEYEQIFDIVDVWFESGSTHAFVCEDREELTSPADLYLEGSDQHRGWFHSSLLESVGTRGVSPYKTVLTHGFVLDDKGYKMSKSLGNVIEPQKIIDQYGADILRLWTMMSDYTEDIRIGDDAIKSASDLYRRIRNTLRFLLGALDGFTSEEAIDLDGSLTDLPELEQLVLHQLHEMDEIMRGHIQNYEFGKIAHKLHEFCNETLSAFYFDIRKDRLYCDRPDGFERRATRTVMVELYRYLTAWLAPILVFTAEEAWSYRPAGVFEDVKSVHLRDFPIVPAQWRNEALSTKWAGIRDVRRVVLGAIEPYRADKTIGSSLEAHPVVYVDQCHAEAVLGRDLAEICITSQVTIKTEEVPADAFTLKDVQGVGVTFGVAEGQKCARCWKILPEVGTDPDYPDLTLRDADAVRWYLAYNNKVA